MLNMALATDSILGGSGTCRRWDPVGENGSVGTSWPWVHLVLQSPSCPPQRKKVSATGSQAHGAKQPSTESPETVSQNQNLFKLFSQILGHRKDKTNKTMCTLTLISRPLSSLEFRRGHWEGYKGPKDVDP